MSEPDSGFYSNFKSPVSLVRRMLSTRDAAAYQALARVGFKGVGLPMDRVWEATETRRLNEASGNDLGQLLVIGGARCGTTFAAQVLAGGLDVGWLDNVAEMFPRSPITAMQKLHRAAWDRSISFHSFYGNTRALGDPNDAFFLWNRWLGNDRYSASLPDDPAIVEDMRRFFSAFGDAFETVLLNKNNRNLAVAADLAAALPNAHFVGITRDPMATVTSLVGARRMTHGDPSAPWGVLAQNTRAHQSELGYIDDVCHQVAAFHTHHERLVAALGPRFTGVTLEAMIEDPVAAIKDVSARTGIPTRAELPTPSHHVGQTAPLSADEEHRARTVLDELHVL